MRLTTTFLLVAVMAISGCKTGMRQSATTGCAASCGATVGVAGCANNACADGCTSSACTSSACATDCKTSCAATCVPAGANGCCATACGACGDTISQAKAAAAQKAELAAQPAKPAAKPATQPNPFVESEIQPTNAVEPLGPVEASAEPATFAPKTTIYRHAEDYRWLVGQLQRVHTPGTEWKIRYAAIDEHDVWGGSMVLARDARLDGFQDGQLVYVEGEILAERPTAYLAGPLYRLNVIRPVTEQDLMGQAGR
jgi:hypothetical protein